MLFLHREVSASAKATLAEKLPHAHSPAQHARPLLREYKLKTSIRHGSRSHSAWLGRMLFLHRDVGASAKATLAEKLPHAHSPAQHARPFLREYKLKTSIRHGSRSHSAWLGRMLFLHREVSASAKATLAEKLPHAHSPAQHARPLLREHKLKTSIRHGSRSHSAWLGRMLFLHREVSASAKATLAEKLPHAHSPAQHARPLLREYKLKTSIHHGSRSHSAWLGRMLFLHREVSASAKATLAEKLPHAHSPAQHTRPLLREYKLKTSIHHGSRSHSAWLGRMLFLHREVSASAKATLAEKLPHAHSPAQHARPLLREYKLKTSIHHGSRSHSAWLGRMLFLHRDVGASAKATLAEKLPHAHSLAQHARPLLREYKLKTSIRHGSRSHSAWLGRMLFLHCEVSASAKATLAEKLPHAHSPAQHARPLLREYKLKTSIRHGSRSHSAWLGRMLFLHREVSASAKATLAEKLPHAHSPAQHARPLLREYKLKTSI